MNKTLKSLAVAVASATVLSVAITGCSPEQKQNQEVEAPFPGYSNPNIYGTVTSKVWSYGNEFKRESLIPVKNPNPYPEPQPHRDHPKAMAMNGDGTKVYIALEGNEIEPGSEVAVYDVTSGKVLDRINVGSSPFDIEAHPNGRFLLVTNRFSNYMSVIDTVKDEVVSEIPADYYMQNIVFTQEGDRAFVSNRYLNQVLVFDLTVTDKSFKGELKPIGGYDVKGFIGDEPKVYNALAQSCAGAMCHTKSRGGFYSGDNQLKAFFSAIENSTIGKPMESMMLRASLPQSQGGFADDQAGANFHAGGEVSLTQGTAEFETVANWISDAKEGPGISVGNFGSKPKAMALSADGKHLFVGNQGTTDVTIVNTETLEEVTGIYTQNVILGLETYHDEATGRELLLTTSMGLGFGAAKERDPLGGETIDPENPAAQFTVLRSLEDTLPLPMEQQTILGQFDAVDGTAASKMSDIQNDITVIDIDQLDIPETQPEVLDYTLLANRYEAHDGWVRYTSDSAEILLDDTSGDIDPALQRVIGAYPEAIKTLGKKAYTVNSGTYELVEWDINPEATDSIDLLVPTAVYYTGFAPKDLVIGKPGTPSEGLVFASAYLGETLTILNTKKGTTEEIVVGDLSVPVGDSLAERGELFVNTTAYSVDQDTTCSSCHINNTSDARGWGAGQAIAQMKDGHFVNGGTLGIPQIKNLWEIQPFYFEGTHTAFDAQFDDAREHVALHGFLTPNPHGDFTNVKSHIPHDERHEEIEEIQDKMSTADYGIIYADLKARRDAMFAQHTREHYGKDYTFRDLQRWIGEFQASETRLVPNPYDQDHPSIGRGRMLFGNLGTNCVTCHPAPNFAEKRYEVFNNHERTMPALISFTPREKAFTLVGPHYVDSVNHYERDLEPNEPGRIERNEGDTTPFGLRGMFDRPFAFLHHGRAKSVRESFISPDHYALRTFKYPVLSGGEDIRPDRLERGFNELFFPEEKTFMLDTHGGTSHLSYLQVQDLENFMLSIE